ncbi:MAG: hypothetical protein ABIQ32_10965 [Sphingomicrobium sp.]
MATQVEGAATAPQRGYLADQQFFTRYAIALVLFIVFGFVQFALRGLSNPVTAPPLVHLHGGLMVSWLGLLIVQNMLVHKGELDLHRKLGWLAAAVVAAIAVVGCMVGINSIARHSVPPFFTDAYFLALTCIGAPLFAATVAWGVTLRRKTQWHRRAMLGSTFLLLEPALGRLLPMPFMVGWGEWVALLFQLGFVWILARHDRKVLGAIHPATKVIALVLILGHVVIELAARLPFTAALATQVAAA